MQDELSTLLQEKVFIEAERAFQLRLPQTPFVYSTHRKKRFFECLEAAYPLHRSAPRFV
jgi:hypothetical protein